MSLLRVAVLIYACLYIIGAILLFHYGQMGSRTFAGGYLLINGLVILGAMLYERSSYKPTVSSNHSDWQRTSERFIDHATGKTMEVHYNPKTGERKYVETNDHGNSAH